MNDYTKESGDESKLQQNKSKKIPSIWHVELDHSVSQIKM